MRCKRVERTSYLVFNISQAQVLGEAYDRSSTTREAYTRATVEVDRYISEDPDPTKAPYLSTKTDLWGEILVLRTQRTIPWPRQ